MTLNLSSQGRATHAQGILLISLSTLAWGSGGLFVRLLPYDMWTIVFWRGVFGSLFIGSFVIYRFGSSLPVVVRAMGRDGILISLCSTAIITVFVPAFQHTSVANAMTIYAALPFLTAAIAWVWLRERPALLTMMASAFALMGIVFMLGPSTGGPRLGDLLAFLATSFAALMTVAIRRKRTVEMLPVACISTGLSVLIAWPLAAHIMDLSARQLGIAAGFGLGPMTLGLMLYIMGSALIPATLTALISTMEAPIGALWAWVGVGEVPAAETLVGGAMVLASVIGRLLVERRAVRRPAT